MNIMKTRQEPAKTVEYVAEKKCDLCGVEIGLFPNGKIDEVTILHRDGNADYDGGSAGTEYEFDLCGKCFQGKLLAMMSILGATPRVTEWDH